VYGDFSMAVTKNKDERTRNWTFVLYPESATKGWRNILDELHVPWVESPLHDKDTNPDGEIKKPHWHIAMFFNSKKSYQQMSEITQNVHGTIPKKIENAKGMIRYFAHMDNPEKYQYPISEILTHGGADIAKYLTASGTDKLQLLSEMQDWIDETGCTEFADLARYARENRFDDWFPIIATQSTIYLNAYIRSKRHKERG
jgi:hypothetical protein